jgi:hypothetical protein
MTDILLSTDDSVGGRPTGGTVVVGINQNLIHPDRWWLLSGIELLVPHGVEDHMLAVVVGMMHNLTVVTNQIDLHQRITSLAPGAYGVGLPWPCAVHVPPRQNLTFTHASGRLNLTTDEVAAWARLQIRAEWTYGRDPRHPGEKTG